MKLLVFSDTHGHTGHLRAALQRHPDAAALFFLGDGLRDIEELEEAHPALRVYAVRGNCDYASFAPQDGLAAFDNVLFYYTHGHLLGVKAGYEQLYFAAKSRGADVALFGHTHRAFCEEWDGVTLLNPGTLSYPDASYGVIELANGKPTFRIEHL